MARPERHDVDYFPFFAKRGKTLNILQSQYGLEGIGFFTNLMRFLALTPDHYYCIKDESDGLNFFAEIGMTDEDKGIAMIDLMVKTGKLDKGLWENHKVIVSEAFLNSLDEAYKKRVNEIITIDEIRAKFEKGGINPVSGAGNPVKAAGNPAENDIDGVSGNGNPQSKVKKSKVKKSKVKKSKVKESKGSSDSDESQKEEKPVALLNREPKNDLERVNKKWLENYIKLHGEQPISPDWYITSLRIKKIIGQVGVEKLLNALDFAMNDKFCLETGYLLKIIVSGNVISKLINKPPSAGPPRLNSKKSLSGLNSTF